MSALWSLLKHSVIVVKPQGTQWKRNVSTEKSHWMQWEQSVSKKKNEVALETPGHLNLDENVDFCGDPTVLLKIKQRSKNADYCDTILTF